MIETKKTTRISKQKRTNGSGQRRKVLHVSDFRDLYELTDDVRKERSGPLRFTRSLVTLSPFASDAESRHFERFRRLKAHPERHLLRSILSDIINWTAAKPFGMRGFLVTAEGKTASSEYLAEQLSISVDEIEKALPTLEQLGFIERISMDGQAEPKKPKRKPGGAKVKASSAKKNRGKSTNASKRATETSTKEPPESAGLSRTEPESVCPSSRKDKDKAKDKSKVKDNQKATSGLTAPGCKENNNGNDISAETKVNVQNKGKDEPLPSEPQESDEGGRANNITRPPDSADISRHGLIYGRKVYLALGYRHDIDSPEAAREIGSFGSKHDQVCSRLTGLSPPIVDRILNRGLNEAKKIAKRKTNRNKGAVWHTVMDKLATAATQ